MQQHHLMDESKRVVHSVIVATDQHESINFQRKMAPLRKKIDELEWRIKELEADKRIAVHEGDSSNAKYIGRNIGKRQKQRKKLMAKMQRMQREYREKRIRFRKIPKVVAAFVTFATDMGRRVVYRRYGNGARCHRYCCQPRALRYHGMDSPESQHVTRVALKKAPEPSTMLWQNLGFDLKKRLCRRVLSSLVATSVIVMAAIDVYFARSADPSQLGKECLGDPVGNGTSSERTGGAESISMFGQEFPCDGWIRDVAQTSEYGDLNLACAQFDEINLARLRKTNASSLERTCGCYTNAIDAVKVGDKETIALCESFIRFVGINSGLQAVAVMSVILVNMIYVIVAKKLGAYEGHHSLDGQESSVGLRVLLGSFLNTGLVLLVVNAQIAKGTGVLEPLAQDETVSSVIKGKYPDFTAEWYSDVGVAMTITMLIYVFSPHMPPLLRYCKFSCKEKTSSTQAGLNSLFVGPDFHHSIRYPQLLVVVFVSMSYSSGIPIMYLIISATAFTFYWVDKYLFTRWYRTPPQYDAQISLQFSGYLPWAMLLHCLFGTWMLSNRRMFSSDHYVPASAGASAAATNSTAATGDASSSSSSIHAGLLAYIGNPNGDRTDFVGCLMQDHVGPMLVATATILVYLIMRQLWAFVGPLMRRCLRCLTRGKCGGHPVVVLKDDYVNEEEHMRQYGLADYNIFANPIYQMMFNVDAEFAETHVHLESLALNEVNVAVKQKQEDKKKRGNSRR
jgi:hypothetical protein